MTRTGKSNSIWLVMLRGGIDVSNVEIAHEGRAIQIHSAATTGMLQNDIISFLSNKYYAAQK